MCKALHHNQSLLQSVDANSLKTVVSLQLQHRHGSSLASPTLQIVLFHLQQACAFRVQSRRLIIQHRRYIQAAYNEFLITSPNPSAKLRCTLPKLAHRIHCHTTLPLLGPNTCHALHQLDLPCLGTSLPRGFHLQADPQAILLVPLIATGLQGYRKIVLLSPRHVAVSGQVTGTIQ
jgi:hypothetical protein